MQTINGPATIAVQLPSDHSPTHSLPLVEREGHDHHSWYWSQSYEPQPHGELDVGDVLQVVLLFIEAEQRTLFAVSRVCRAWRARSAGLPQWKVLLAIEGLNKQPQKHVLAPILTSQVVTRERYVAEIRLARQLHPPAELSELAKVMHTAAFVLSQCFLLGAFPFAFGLTTGLVSAFLKNAKPMQTAALAYVAGCVGAAFLVVMAVLLGFIIFRQRDRSRWGGARSTALLFWSVVVLALSGSWMAEFAVLEAQATTLGRLSSHVLNAGDCIRSSNSTAGGESAHWTTDVPDPIYLSIPRKSLGLWQFADRTAELPAPQAKTATVALAFLTANVSVCPALRILAVVVPPGGLHPDWWESIAEATDPTANVSFRTVRSYPFLPLPLWMHPEVPWDLANLSHVTIGSRLVDLPSPHFSIVSATVFLIAFFGSALYVIGAAAFVDRDGQVHPYNYIFPLTVGNPLCMLGFGITCLTVGPGACWSTHAAAVHLLVAGAVGVLLCVAAKGALSRAGQSGRRVT